jgi:hypothetical protein
MQKPVNNSLLRASIMKTEIREGVGFLIDKEQKGGQV